MVITRQAKEGAPEGRLEWAAEKDDVPVFTGPEGRAWVDSYLTDVFWKEEVPSEEDV
jgi:hypothetical protein